MTLAPDRPASALRREEAPVPLDPLPPIQFPDGLAAQRLGGSVLLRLYVDSTGRVVPESTAIQESSGYPAFDSAAVEAAPRVRYAPALRDGVPVASPFLQPINFRTPARGGTPR
jgi:TonB family protein